MPTKESVLVVEDEPRYQRLLCGALESRGIKRLAFSRETTAASARKSKSSRATPGWCRQGQASAISWSSSDPHLVRPAIGPDRIAAESF